MTVKQGVSIARVALNALTDMKGQNIRLFDTRKLSNMFDTVIVCNGTSNRHTRSLANSVYGSLKSAGIAPLTVEGEGNGEWVLVDAGDVVVHLMLPLVRQYYNLEALWGDKELKFDSRHADLIEL